MMNQVWLIADQRTGEVSYIQHGREGDEANWRWVGPFAFTTSEAAEEAAVAPKFLPQGITGTFTPLAVDTASFIRAVYNGFPPRHSDVFVLDGALLPLTANGATWVDEAQEVPIWAPLFDEDGEGAGLDWLDHVLQIMASRLSMNMETVQAIGTLNAAEEDAAEVEQTQSLIHQHVRLTLTPEPGTIKIGNLPGPHRLTPQAEFWLHTNGMKKLGLPELEIRSVPAWWVHAAGTELLHWAVYSLDHGISEGDILQGGGPVLLDIRVTNSLDERWKGHPTGCLCLEVAGVTLLADASDQTPSVTDGWDGMLH